MERAAHGGSIVPESRNAPESAPPGTRYRAERKTKTAPSRRSTGSTAKGYLEAARAAAQEGELDAAVEHAEALLELGAVGTRSRRPGLAQGLVADTGSDIPRAGRRSE